MRGDGLFKRRKMWWYGVTLPNGTYERRSTHTRDYQEAKRIRQQVVGEVATSGGSPRLARATFEDGCELIRTDYTVRKRRSRGTLEGALTRLTERFAGWQANAIGWGEAMSYRQWREGQGYAIATINKDLAALKRMLRLLARAGKLSQVPLIECPEARNARQGFVEREDLEAVLKELPAPYRAPIRFAYCTGWRLRSEVIGLKWANVDRAAGIVRLEVNTTKNADGRTFPFDVLPELAQLMETLYAARNGPHLFHDGGQPIAYRPLLDAWHAACAAAEVRGRLLHDLRRSAVRNLERAGVSRSVAMKLTGHKTEAVYRRYAITNEQDLRDGVRKLSGVTIMTHAAPA
jgi:integrase